MTAVFITPWSAGHGRTFLLSSLNLQKEMIRLKDLSRWNNRSEMRQARNISSSSSSSIIGGSCHKYRFLSRQLFCRDKIMFSRQNYVCRDTCLPWQMFAVTIFLSRQNKKIKNRDKTFVTTSILLSRQNTCYVATKMVLVTAPANDTPQYCWKHSCCKTKQNKCPAVILIRCLCFCAALGR